jgi:hypothetical protein
MVAHSVPGPKRQLTPLSSGDAMGMVGVGVNNGSGVFVGRDVKVGTGVSNGTAGVSVKVGALGVGVTSPEGRLHARMARIKTRLASKIRLFIRSLLYDNDNG